MWHSVEVGYRPWVNRRSVIVFLAPKQHACVYLVISTSVTFISSAQSTPLSALCQHVPELLKACDTKLHHPYVWQTRPMHQTDLICKLNKVRFENITLHLISLYKSQMIAWLNSTFYNCILFEDDLLKATKEITTHCLSVSHRYKLFVFNIFSWRNV